MKLLKVFGIFALRSLSISAIGQARMLIDYLSSGGRLIFTTNLSGNMVLDNAGSGDATYDAASYAGRALQLGATNSLPIPTFVGGYTTYHNIVTNTVTQEATDGTPKSFLSITVNNILTTHIAFSPTDLAKIQSNPNLLAKLALSATGSIPELEMVLVGDESYYACSEGAGAGVLSKIINPTEGEVIFNTVATTQTYTMRMPVDTSVTVNGVVYNGAGNTNVVATVNTAGKVTIKESADGVLTYLMCQSNQLTGSIPNLSSNTELTQFDCSVNQLTGSIPNLSNNSKLTTFYSGGNKLTGSIPDLSNNTALVVFYCNSNQLTGFAGGTIKVSTRFDASNNKLAIAAVDAILQGLVDGGTTGVVTINLSGGTTGVPTNTTAIDTLRARGCTVTVNV